MTPFVASSRSELQDELNRLYSRQRHLEWQIFVVSADWERQRLRTELAQTKKEVADVQSQLNVQAHQSNPWLSQPRPQPVVLIRPRPTASVQLQQRRKLLMLASLVGCVVLFINLLQVVVVNGGFHHNGDWDNEAARWSRHAQDRVYPESNPPQVPTPLYTPASPLLNPKTDGFEEAHLIGDFEQARRLGDSEKVISIGEQLLIGYDSNLTSAPPEIKSTYSDLIAAYRDRAFYYLNTDSSTLAVRYYSRLVVLDGYYPGATAGNRGEDYYHYGQSLEANRQLSVAKSAYQTAVGLGEPAAQAALARIAQN